jgi:3'-phosphoadenosine 5'-phosphosulfate sulfotransferase (PAPS reductase)/FAD synthetase
MADPFRIAGPALVSFSGGRTSAYMLWRILQAHGGTLPDDVRVTFANTGKEMPQTLDFVRDCGERWGVEIVWLEYRDHEDTKQRFRVVTHETASRNGEPFRALIDRKGFLPNPVTRFCTSELKVRPMRDYARLLGWQNWTNAIGLRADEPGRVAKSRHNKEAWDNSMPLADAGVTRRDVRAFWAMQNFDLHLPNIDGVTPLGNCDLCFLKSAATISGIMRDMPDRAKWWIEAEAEAEARASKPSGALFRTDRPSYAAMFDAVQRQQAFDFGDADEIVDCFCGEPG